MTTHNEAQLPGGFVRQGEEAFLTSIGRAGNLDLFVANDLSAIASIWRLFQISAWHTPFQELGWLQSWYETVSADGAVSPFIVLGYDGVNLQFIMPLVREDTGLATTLRWMASDVNDYNCPVIDPGCLADLTEDAVDAVWNAIVQASGPVDSVILDKQPTEIADRKNPFPAQEMTSPSSCNSHTLQLRRDWKALLASLRGTKSRRRLREKAKRLKKLGAVQFREVRGEAERNRAIEQILTWKSDQLDHSGDRNPFSPGSAGTTAKSDLTATIGSYAGLKTARGKMRVYGLFVDGALLAGMIAFTGKSTFSLFVTAYDAGLPGNYSVGTILLIKSMELASRSGMKTYDFLAGDEAYKFEWCNRQLVMLDCRFGVTPTGQFFAWGGNFSIAMKKVIKSNPSAMNLLKGMNRLRILATNQTSQIHRYSSAHPKAA